MAEIISLLYLLILNTFLIVFILLISIETYSLLFYKSKLLKKTRGLETLKFAHLNITINVAKVYLYKKKFKQAGEKFEKIINKYKNELNKELKSQIYNSLGMCYFNLNYLELAIRYYTKSIKLNNNCTITLNNLARAYEQRHLFGKAKNIYLQVLKINPKDYTARQNLIKLDCRDSRI
nr:hypothetical protein [Cyanidiaceae sp.]